MNYVVHTCTFIEIDLQGSFMFLFASGMGNDLFFAASWDRWRKRSWLEHT